MKFRKEEINLCKQIGEKHRKETQHGDWYISYDGVIKLKALHQKGYRNEECILFWTISDCLEFLDKTKDITLRICSHPDINQTTVEYDDSEYYGKTPLEACLKAVLAVLEEGK